MDLMIDLETMGTAHNTAVVSIGAIFFDLEKKVLGPTFYAVLDREDQLKKGCTYTKETMQWWAKQDEAAKAVLKKPGVDTKYALEQFIAYYKQHPKAAVWGNGSTFDISIMQTLLDTYELPVPWPFWNIMDLRTFKRFVAKGKSVVVDGTKHNALDDAKAQAEFVLQYA